MRTLSTKEWVAVVVALFVIGFFFLFGQSLISFFTGGQSNINVMTQQKVSIQDTLVGTGDIAGAGDRVTVHYTGRFIDGTIFDSSLTRGEPFQFILDVGQVIKGWDDGVAGMRVGGKRILSVPPELGYGANDYGPIPGGSTLIFEIELLKVER